MTSRTAIVMVAITGVLGLAQTTAPRPVSTQVSPNNLVDTSGTVSRDGRYLSFMGPFGLTLLDLATYQSRMIVPANPANGGSIPGASAISRDATLLAYSWFERAANSNSLWVASVIGDPKPRQIYGDPAIRSIAPRDWSPDGKWIATLISTTDFNDQLALVAVETGAPRVLKNGRWPGGSRIFFSPDGKYLAYDLQDPRTNARDVWITAVDLSKDQAVVTHRANDSVMGWAPDGTSLLFVSDRTGSNALWSLPVREGASAGTPVFLKPDMGLSQSLGITNSGALFFGTNSGFRGGSIMVGTFDFTSGAVNFARDVSTNPQEDNVNPTWSPDGKYLAYISVRGRPSFPVLVLRTGDTGGLVREIEPQLLDAGLADWHPDAIALLMVGHDFKGNQGAFRVDAETGVASLVHAIPENTPSLSMPVWSRDGRSLYYWNRTSAGEHVFVARDLSSGAESELVRRPFLGCICVSPAGQHIATETVDPATNERVLLLVPLGGGPPRDLMHRPSGVTAAVLRNVTSSGVRLSPTAWTSDSKSVVIKLQSAAEAPSELWVVPIDGSAPRKLPSILPGHIFKFAISGDGRRVAYRMKEAEAAPPPQIWKFEHFLSAPAGR